MAGKIMRKPGRARMLTAIHEQTALAGLVAIARPRRHPARRRLPQPRDRRDHDPGRDELPAAVDRPRDRRRLPRRDRSASASTSAAGSARGSGARPTGSTVVVYALAVAHTLGAGTDASDALAARGGCWLTAPPIAVLFAGPADDAVAQPPRQAGARERRAPAHGPRAPRRVEPRPSSREDAHEPAMASSSSAAGLAAQRCAETLRARGYDGAVRIVCAEPELPYDRPPLSKGVLAGEAETRRRPLPRAGAGTRTTRRAAARARGRPRSTRPPRSGRARRTAARLAYDELLIATGAAPRSLPLLERLRQRDLAADPRRRRGGCARELRPGRAAGDRRRRVHRPGGRGDRARGRASR